MPQSRISCQSSDIIARELRVSRSRLAPPLLLRSDPEKVAAIVLLQVEVTTGNQESEFHHKTIRALSGDLISQQRAALISTPFRFASAMATEDERWLLILPGDTCLIH